MKNLLDKSDRKILNILQKDGRCSVTSISEKIFLSIPATRERIKRLERLGIITDYVAIVDRATIEMEFRCVCFINLEKKLPQNEEKLQIYVENSEEILSCHGISGEYQYVLDIVTYSPRRLEQIFFELRKFCNLKSSNTYTVLSELKDSVFLDLIE